MAFGVKPFRAWEARVIWAAPGSQDQAAPLLQVYGQRLVLLWTNAGFFDVLSAKPGQVSVVDNDVTVHASWSDDDGATWAEQRQVAAFHGISVRALASTGTQGDPTVFFGSPVARIP